MPRFQIKRRAKKPEPEVQPQAIPEEESESLDLSMEFDEDMESPTKPLNKKISHMTLDQEPEEVKVDEMEVEEPEYHRPGPMRRSRVVEHTPERAPNQFYREPRAPRRREMFNKLRSIDYPRPSRSRNGQPKLKYSSGYGANSGAMTTQEKARRLLHSCFG